MGERLEIVAADDAGIARAAAALADGQLVGMPTETVYGLACHAFDAAAAARVFEAKQRPSFDPLIVHVASSADAWALVGGAAENQSTLDERGLRVARVLAEAFWPGALTLVLPRPECVPGIVTSGLGTVGVRVPAHPVARGLIAALGEEVKKRGRGRADLPGAVAAPSANVFGGVSPTRAEHVAVPCALVLDGGPCATGLESTVVRPTPEGGVVVLRLGGVTLEQLGEVAGEANVTLAKPGEKLASPGMLERHYAPRTPLHLVSKLEQIDPGSLGGQRVGVLTLTGERGRGMGFAAAEVLSARGDLVEAAANLFAALHRLDAAGLDVVVAEAVPDEGLGRAINDRLRRAAG